MDLALSNFAWDKYYAGDIFNCLRENNITQVETILTKLKDWDKLTYIDLMNYKITLDDYNLISYSIQSLFYGVDCKITDVDVIVSHFKRVINCAVTLGSKILVFGSPSLRQKHEGWEDALVNIFTQVDKLLEGKDIKVVIEPNASIYNGQFFHNIDEIVNFIKENNLINIRTMVDTHNSILEKRNPMSDFLDYIDYIEHIHISEPKLVPIIDKSLHLGWANIIKNSKYDKTITYEVSEHDTILDNIKIFAQIYNK
jgi:sugar phosphate isomerase/epimerase